MIVTALEEQKNDKSKVSVFVDGKYSFSLLKTDAEFFKLKEGFEIKKETFDYILENIIYIKAQDTALNFLKNRLKTEAQVRQKLNEKDFSEEIIEKVIDFLIKYKYLDDKHYVNAYINDCKRLKPKSKLAIKLELLKRGVKRDVIDDVFSYNDVDEISDCCRILEKKIDDFLDLPFEKKRKVFNYLTGKGYSYETVNTAFLLCIEKQEENYGI